MLVDIICKSNLQNRIFTNMYQINVLFLLLNKTYSSISRCINVLKMCCLIKKKEKKKKEKNKYMSD
jgi:hypothetical protein